MKRLTMNHVARANLRHNRKAYLSLATGIFLAVYLACTACLCIVGAMEASDAKMARKVGWADSVLTHNSSLTTGALRRTELFDEIGHVYVTSAVGDSGVFIGRYDETAERLLYRRCAQGRMPVKPGEIAAEQSALDRLGLEEKQIGDTVTWQLKPFGVVDDLYEEREFVLVGILTEQSNFFAEGIKTDMHGFTNQFPAILTHSDEPDCQYGTRCVHWVMTNRPGVSLTQIQQYEKLPLGSCMRVSRVSGTVSGIDQAFYELNARMSQIVIYVILGCALLLVNCVAIASAMESMLAQKTEDIGMMRAVGATQRQIRRLYSRDVWLLSLTALPVGTVLSCLTVWAFSVFAPQDMHFCPEPWLLIPVMVISILCVLISSRAPLRRSSRQLPMGVLRDTAALRKARKFRQRRAFKGPQLIASRQFRLHPMRQAGSACMAGLMLLCALLLGEILFAADWHLPGNTAAFTLETGYDLSIRHEPFVQNQRDHSGLSLNDMNQIRTLPMVSRTETVTRTQVILPLPDKIPAYFRSVELANPNPDPGYSESMSATVLSGTNGFYLTITDTATPADFIREYTYNVAVCEAQQMRLVQKVLGIRQPLVPVVVYAADLNHVDFKEVLKEGEVDLDALDAGREVLVSAPDFSVFMSPEGWFTQVRDVSDPRAQAVFINDYFRAGMELSMVQLFGKEPGNLFYNSSDEDFLAYYASVDRTDAAPRIGAVLNGAARLVNIFPNSLCIITTPKGAEALGLKTNGVEGVDIFLSAIPDAEAEAMLESKISRIGVRGGMESTNNLAVQREAQAYQKRLMLVFCGMVLLFFAVAVSMQVTNTARRIRADERMVGTLRAVGADEFALFSCYRLPAIISAAAGYVLAAAVYLLMYFLYPIGFPKYHLWLLAVALILAVMNASCVLFGVRRQLRRVLDKSIVENIREL
ncbi:MAG: ABC transporter permease [Clostridia bacterium]|nr:ABC transporter permease [Clostridia bacterium]